MAADSDFSLTTNRVSVSIPDYSVYVSATAAHKKYYDKNAHGSMKLYTLEFNALTPTNFNTFMEHYNMCAGAYRRFVWTNPPSYVRHKEHAKICWALTLPATYTDETAAAAEETADDMNLFPAAPATGIVYVWGSDGLFDELDLRISTAGAGTWTMKYQYWNGGWADLAGVTDNTNHFKTLGKNTVTWTQPTDWVAYDLNGVTAFWLAAHVTYTNKTVLPKGQESWIDVEPYYVHYYSAVKPTQKLVGAENHYVKAVFQEHVL